ncbi:MAG: 50S ribosomal protein L9 [Clostridia bacterium]|nr:50S ribosomal protein L9 [Clostridia bacterium]
MKVILKQDIKGVGRKNEVINASDGYARNFLFPKNLAIEANAENMNKLNSQNEAKQYQKGVEREQAKEIAKMLETITLQIKVQAGENGKIFGSVSAKEITENLENQYKIKIDKKKIDLKEAIKTVGVTTVSVKLYEGVTGKIKIEVIS